MTFVPMVPVAVIVLLVVAYAVLLWLGARWIRHGGAAPGAWRRWWRRGALAALVPVILAGPSVELKEKVPVSSIEVYLVVDRTGSMAAQDWDGGKGTRLDGVRADLTAIRDAYAAARFSVIALDSTAARELPLTSDVEALTTWIANLTPEISSRSSGSSVDRALPLVTQILSDAKEHRPGGSRILYVLSDGESTEDGATPGTINPSWSTVAGYIQGGAVLGYGTKEGGTMRQNTGTGATDAPLIQDPSGKDAVSVPDTQALSALASALGVTYIQRTGTNDEPTSKFTDLNVEGKTTEEDRTRRSSRYVVWPLGVVAAGLLIWEVASLGRADVAARRLVSRSSLTPTQTGGRR